MPKQHPKHRPVSSLFVHRLVQRFFALSHHLISQTTAVLRSPTSRLLISTSHLPSPKHYLLRLNRSLLSTLLVFGLVLGTVYTYTRTSASERAYAAPGINRQINFQGKLVNPNGTNVTDGTYSIVFSIYTVSSGGTAVWTETQTPTITNGIFQVNLGSVTALPGSVDFNTDNLYLGIRVGADAEMTPRVQFTSVPQAFNAERLGGLTSSGFIQNTTTQQAATNFNIAGTGVIGTSLTTPILQSAAGTGLTITGNAASTWSTTAGNLALQSGGTGNITFTPSSANALVNVLTGNFKVGDGTPTVTLNGEDAYIEGTLEVDGTSRFDAAVTISTGGLTVSAGTTSITGTTTINTTGTAATSIGNATGVLTVTGALTSNFVIGGVTISGSELNRLDGKDANLVDTNDATATAITGTGALNAGSITSGFGTINNADTITGTTINGTTGLNTGAGAGTQRIDAGGNLSNIGTITSTGNWTTTGAISAIGLNASGYQTQNTSSTFSGQYTRIASCTLTTQYQDCRTQATIVAMADGGSFDRTLVDIRVKQQNAMAGVPYIVLQLSQSIGITTADVVAVTTQNDAAATTVEVYGKINATFRVWNMAPLINAGTNKFTWQSTQGFSTTLPAGTQTAATYANDAGLAGTYFLQGGNSFGADAILGTNDARDLILETNGTARLTIAPNGYAIFSNELQVNGASNLYGNVGLLNGNDVILQAGTAVPTDPGDLIFRSNTGTEYGRIYSNAANGLNLSGGTNTSTDLVVGEGYVSVNGLLQTNGTTRLDGSGNLSNIGTFTSTGAMNVSNTISGTRLISTVATGTAPLTVTSTTMVNNLNVQYLNGMSEIQIAQSLRANNNVTGGGTVSWSTAAGMGWTTRFIVISNGRGSDFSTAGYYDINMPADGTVITGVGGAANATVAGGRVPLGAWNALYYILPIGSNNTSQNANFRIASYTANMQVPSNWVLLGVYNGDNSTLRTGTGITLRSGQSTTSGTVDNVTFNTSVSAPVLVSTVATGTSPLQVTSTTQVNNLNVQYVGGLQASQFIRSDADDTTTGRLAFSGTSNGNAYNQSAIEIIEAWSSGAGLAPRLAFHYSGAVASQIGFLQGDNSADISILDNPGTGYEGLRVGELKVAATTVIDSSRNITNVVNASIGGTLSVTGNATYAGTITLTDNVGAGVAKLFVGDDTFFTDVDITSMLGIRSASNNATGGIQLGSGNAYLFGNASANLGIGTASPGYKLDVAGDVNTSGVFRINGTAICTSSGCTAAGGGTNLQGAYNTSTGGATPEIKLDSTRGALNIQDADTTIGTDLLVVNGSNASGLGTQLLKVTNSGDLAVRGDIVRVVSTASQTDNTAYTSTSAGYSTVKTFTFSISGDRTVQSLYWTGTLAQHASTAGNASYPTILQLACGPAGNRKVLATVSHVNASALAYSLTNTSIPLACYGYNGNVTVDVMLGNGNGSSSFPASVSNETVYLRYAPLGGYRKTTSQTDNTAYTSTSAGYSTVKTFTFSISGDRTVQSLYWTGTLAQHASTAGNASYPTILQLACGPAGNRKVLATVSHVNASALAYSLTNTSIPLACYGYNGNVTVDVMLGNGNGSSSFPASVSNETVYMLYDEGSVNSVSSSTEEASSSTTTNRVTDPQHSAGLNSTPVYGNFSGYQVPSGKTLYLTSISSPSSGYNVGIGSALNNGNVCTGSTYYFPLNTGGTASIPFSLETPVPVPGGAYLCTSQQFNSFNITGYLVDTTVTPVYGNFSGYQVPSGKTLYLTSISSPSSGYNVGIGSALNNGNVCTGSTYYFPLSGSTGAVPFSLETPVPVPGGAYLCTSQQFNSFNITGYLASSDGTTGADLAEQYFVIGGGEAGDIVAIDPNSTANAPAVSKTSGSFDSKMIAVISTKPGITLGDETTASGENVMAIALNGRVPTKVTTESGCIAVGDPITSSSIPGVGMRASGVGRVVGYALESYCGTEQTKIMVFINPNHQNQVPNGVQDQTGIFTNLNVSGEATFATLAITGGLTVGGNLTVSGLTTVADIKINGHIITQGDIPTVENILAPVDVTYVIDGNDTAGTITITTGAAGIQPGDLFKTLFNNSFSKTPRIILSPNDEVSANAKVFAKNRTNAEFVINTTQNIPANQTLTFDYFVVE